VNDGEDRHEENKHAGEAFIEQTTEIAGSAAGFTEMTVTPDEASTSEPPRVRPRGEAVMSGCPAKSSFEPKETSRIVHETFARQQIIGRAPTRQLRHPTQPSVHCRMAVLKDIPCFVAGIV
jgi:hypothetical protein